MSEEINGDRRSFLCDAAMAIAAAAPYSKQPIH